MSDDIFELSYISAATAPFSGEQLQSLLAVARARNARLGITGLLLYTDGSFLQFLEGREEDVLSLYETKIGRDRRHNRLLRLFAGQRHSRAFGEWTMGFAEASQAFAAAPGFNDFLRSGAVRTIVAPELASRARDLAAQFRVGRWRQHVDGR